jgi:hypothetical protein
MVLIFIVQSSRLAMERIGTFVPKEDDFYQAGLDAGRYLCLLLRL